MVEKFDYQKYLKLWGETLDEKYYFILYKRVVDISREITEKIINERPNYHPSDSDEYQIFREEMKLIREKLKLYNRTTQQNPPENIQEIRDKTKVIEKK